MQALAYDVPIPGYQTKNTISLRLWEAKASADDFDLFLFNDGQLESASVLHSRAQQVGIDFVLLPLKNNQLIVDDPAIVIKIAYITNISLSLPL